MNFPEQAPPTPKKSHGGGLLLGAFAIIVVLGTALMFGSGQQFQGKFQPMHTTETPPPELARLGYLSVPMFSKHTNRSNPCPTSTIEASDNAVVYCFSVKAFGSNQIGLHKLAVEVAPYLVDTAELETENALKLHRYDDSGVMEEDSVAEGTWSNETNTAILTFRTEEYVPANETYYYALTAPVSFIDDPEDAPSLSSRLCTDKESCEADVAEAITGGVVWSDCSDGDHSLASDDWYNAYELTTLPTEYLVLIGE